MTLTDSPTWVYNRLEEVNMDINISTVNRSQVARITGTDLAHISRIFNGKATPSLDLAKRIADSLEITVDQLIKALPERNHAEVS